MPAELDISQQLSLITVRITCDLLAGGRATSTGFFIDASTREGKLLPLIITNRHVISGAKSFHFSMTKGTPDGGPEFGSLINLTCKEAQEAWVGHPDPNVDLCALPFSATFTNLKNSGKSFAWRCFGKEQLATPEFMKGLTAMQPVKMIGYPIGLHDEVNNMPIFRSGVTATHPFLDFNGRKEFVVDMACFPGSSGSPVILYREPLPVKAGAGVTVSGNEPVIRLLGVLYAGPQYTAKGSVTVLPVPNALVPVAETSIPANLGYVIKCERVIELARLMEERAAAKETASTAS